MDSLQVWTGSVRPVVEGAVRMGDEELIAGVAGGDASAFEQLYDRYSRAVYSLILRLVGQAQVAQETVQEVFMSLWREARDFDRSRGSVKSWILSLAHHKGVDAVRRLRVRATEPLPERDGLIASSGDPEAGAMRALRQTEVVGALRTLSHEQREAIVLAYYGGYTQQEIAQRLQVPLGTVKTRVRDGMTRLRRLLAGGEDLLP
ncbi:MAG: sigma-70 family RNA polymerase sigma factor [bacterium]